MSYPLRATPLCPESAVFRGVVAALALRRSGRATRRAGRRKNGQSKGTFREACGGIRRALSGVAL